MRFALVMVLALMTACGSAIVAPSDVSCPNALAQPVEMRWRPYPDPHGPAVLLDSMLVVDRYIAPLTVDSLRLPLGKSGATMVYGFGAGHCVTLRDSLGVNFWSTR